MKISSTKLILFSAIISFIGCGPGENSGTNANLSVSDNQSAIIETANANISKDNLEELDRLVKLPFLPEEATYREDVSEALNSDTNSLSPKGKKLTVVLKYSAENAQKIVEQIDKSQSVTSSNLDAESWFPPELVAKSGESGDESLKGISYNAESFLQEPYKNGKITRINDTDFFVLELTTF